MVTLPTFTYHGGPAPLLVSIPHSGTHVPEDLLARMTDAGRALPDTDWQVDRLYDFLHDLGASVLTATHARYVIDLNRPPDGSNLYPGRDTPGLVPTHTFAGEPIWRSGEQPNPAEIEARRQTYWQPYHDQLAATLKELRAEHGVALLWDAHSIASRVPRLFEGQLPDLNLGTADGRACHASIRRALHAAAQSAKPYSAVLDGRFRGGYITRHHGDPARGVHAVQLELAQDTYMDGGTPPTFSDARAAQLRPVLRTLLNRLLAVA